MKAGNSILVRGVLFAVIYALLRLIDGEAFGEALFSAVIGGVVYALLSEGVDRWLQKRRASKPAAGGQDEAGSGAAGPKAGASETAASESASTQE